MVRNLTSLKQNSNDFLNATPHTNSINVSSTLTQPKLESDFLMSNLSSSSSSASSSSDQIVFNQQTSFSSNTCTYICVITDLTDPTNTCKRHVINLASDFSIESLIQAAAEFFSYDPSSFNLVWKTNDEEKKVIFIFISQCRHFS